MAKETDDGIRLPNRELQVPDEVKKRQWRRKPRAEKLAELKKATQQAPEVPSGLKGEVPPPDPEPPRKKRKRKRKKKVDPDTLPVPDGYKIIYRQTFDDIVEGDVNDIRKGDVVSYFDKGYRNAVVEKVWGVKVRRIKTKPLFYNGTIIRRGRVFKLDQLRMVLRPE